MDNKKKLSLMQEFNIAVSESVQYKNGLKNIGNYKYYYPKSYGERVKRFLKDLGVDSKEDSKNSLSSAASSARLCTNYFYERAIEKKIEFEKPLHNDVWITPTKMDAVAGLTFYECKCQEIVYGEHELLPKSYNERQSSELFKEFEISNVQLHENGSSCDFSLKDSGINYPGKYYDINFNVKQLICHLIAIAHDYDSEEKKTLKYIVFKPKKESISKSVALKDLYDRLDQQFKAIVESQKITDFCTKYHIALEMEYVYIDEIEEHFGDNN